MRGRLAMNALLWWGTSVWAKEVRRPILRRSVSPQGAIHGGGKVDGCPGVRGKMEGRRAGVRARARGACVGAPHPRREGVRLRSSLSAQRLRKNGAVSPIWMEQYVKVLRLWRGMVCVAVWCAPRCCLCSSLTFKIRLPSILFIDVNIENQLK